jgi:hypothetical protein
MTETEREDLVAWRGEYDPLTPRGALRFICESFLAVAIVVRCTAHSLGVLVYARDRDAVRDDLTTRYRPYRFAVTQPDIPVRTEALVRVWTGFFALTGGLVLFYFNFEVGGSTGAVLATVLAAVNWGLLVADPVLFAAEQHRRGD